MNSLSLSLSQEEEENKLCFMAADVSSLVRVLGGRYKDDRTAGNDQSIGGSKPSSPMITRDLLGGGAVKDQYQELDLDLQVPTGWEKRLDLKSGKVYLQRCNSTNSSLSSDHHQKNQTNQTVVQKLQDLNFPPSPSKPLLNLFDETSLELKLVSSSSGASHSQSSSNNNNNYQSVCTLDKVKSALERAKKDPNKKRVSSMWNNSSNTNNNNSPLSPSYSSSSASSIKDGGGVGGENEETNVAQSIATGCPGCLCYVLIMKNNPKCPRCNSIVPMPAMKKPKIDLNMSI